MENSPIETPKKMSNDEDTLFGEDFYNSDEIGEYAVKAAAGLVDVQSVELKPTQAPSAEVTYDKAAKAVERQVDQGIDAKVAWNNEDPTGAIRRGYNNLENQIQYNLNNHYAEKDRRNQLDRQLREAEKITDPRERKKATDYIKARMIVADDRRKQRW